jgi:hemoglobin
MKHAILAVVALLIAAAPARAADDSLYRDLGGRENIALFVHTATDDWVKDPIIGYTFDNLNLERFEQRLTDQICELAGGPCKYTGRNMYLSHKGLHLSETEFYVLCESLQRNMDKAHVSFHAQNRLLEMLAPMKRDIVGR